MTSERLLLVLDEGTSSTRALLYAVDGTLVATARRNHVDFVYAVSPGPSVCFSDPADAQALERKFAALR